MKFKIYLIISVLILALFLRTYRLDELMMFIGDQGWFYISARDLLIGGKVPLVGITTSHTWLHQGALWTYMLGTVLWLFNFNPVVGAYFAAFMGIISVWAIYFVGKSLFKNEQVGLIAATLFATSPLVVIHSRMAYHTAPIPLFTLLFIFAIYKYAKREMLYLPLATFVLGILYNLELATMVFWVMLLIFFLYVRRFETRILILSIISFLIPMIPMIIYDFASNSGFYQTTALFRLIKISLLNNSFSSETIPNIFTQLFVYNQRLVFLGSGFVSTLITLSGFIFLVRILYRSYKRKKTNYAFTIIGLWIILSLSGIFISKTASEAYLPMLYPGIILLVSFFFVEVIKNISVLKTGVYIIIGAISFINVYLLLSQDYLMKDKGYGTIFSDRVEAGKKIISISENSEYNIIGKGAGSEHENFTKNYEYITWWLGKAPSEKKEKIQFIIQETSSNVILEKKML